MRRTRRHSLSEIEAGAPVVGESKSLLYPSQITAEFALQAGKVQNLREVARRLNGIRIPAGEIFSFWAQVPRPSMGRGFALGRELREGCVIPSIGGGLCQMSNALYEVALKSGFEIVERHGHSRILPGSMAEAGRDATIFWNYVDLRFKPATDVQMEIVLGRGELLVRVRDLSSISQSVDRDDSQRQRVADPPAAGELVESCETCGVTDCFRHPETLHLPTKPITAWLVDAYWPEYNAYIRRNRTDRDCLFLPLDSHRFRLGNYLWDRSGFAEVHQSPMAVARRSVVSRRLAAQGAARQRALLQMDEQLAKSYLRRIPYAASHLVVSQNLLPFLWQHGVLGGRTFDVLMTRPPMTELQATLDRAAKRWPMSPTLADFRADPRLLELERQALAEARSWITPHSEVARLAGDRAMKLDWHLPKMEPVIADGDRWLFPASTLGRKGAWELRELARRLDLSIKVTGPNLELPDFWEGIDVEQGDFSLQGVRGIILPTWVEHQPRRLLQAVASGLPVFASRDCGLEGIEGVTVVDSFSDFDPEQRHAVEVVTRKPLGRFSSS